MNFSQEYITKAKQFTDMMHKDKEFMAVVDKIDMVEFSAEDESIIKSWIEAGDPAIYDFFMNFMQSDCFKEALKT